MALIKCSECERDVSDKAAACPNCGAPIAAAALVPASGAVIATPNTHVPVVPIEQTGKAFKGQMLGGAALSCIGIVVVIAGGALPGALMLVGGVGLYFIGRFGAWWNHG